MIDTFNLYMKNYYDKHKLLVISFLSTTILFVISESVILPFIIAKLIENIKNPNLYLNYLVVIFIVLFILFYLKKKCEYNFLPDLLTYPRNLFFTSLIDKYSENYKSLKMGSNISRINLITWIFRECVFNFIMDILPNIIILLFMTLLFLYLNINVGLIILLSLILFTMSIILFNKRLYRKVEYANRYYFKIDNELNDIFSSLMNTYLNNNEVKEKERIQNDQNIYNTGIKDIYIVDSNLSNILFFITVITSIILIFYITLYDKENKIIKIILLVYFTNSLFSLSKIFPIWLYRYYVTKDSNSYVKNILNIHSDVFNKEIKTGSLELKNLNFGYKKNHIILKNINLNIKDKEKVAIIGRSGSGKSTLSKILLKFYKYNGIILVDNKDIKKINTKYLRTKVLYANQRTVLYDISVMDNIKYGNNVESEYILKVLSDYELLEVFSGLKNGIYSDSGVQGNELSGGMQKIVIILRTIFKLEESNGLIIILDEPLAGLDAKTRQKVIKLINNKCSGKTLIIITHDKEILPFMDRIIDLSEINNKVNKSEKIRNIKK